MSNSLPMIYHGITEALTGLMWACLATNDRRFAETALTLDCIITELEKAQPPSDKEYEEGIRSLKTRTKAGRKLKNASSRTQA